MAILWQRRAHGTTWQVRSAGHTLRLYTDGVLHTQYNPRRLLTGSIWDLLLLAAFARATPPRRVLVLGVGGGAVLRQLASVFPGVHITGIELSAVHLQLARRFFGVRGDGIELVRDNAVTWLSMYDGAPFDLVIDDLFGNDGGVPARAVPADAGWLDLLAMHVAPGGVLALNMDGRTELRAALAAGGRPLRRRFPAALSLSTPTCDNRVLLLGGRDLAPAVLAARLRAAGLPGGVAGLRYRARAD